MNKKLELIKIGGCYTNVETSESVEVLEFKDFDLKDDSYARNIKTVVYIDDNSDMQSMEIHSFAKNFV